MRRGWDGCPQSLPFQEGSIAESYPRACNCRNMVSPVLTMAMMSA